VTHGLPEIVIKHPLIEQIGEGCRIDESVSIWRRGDLNPADPLITIGDGVILFENVRIVVSNKNESQLAGIHLGNRVAVNVGSFLSGEGGLCIEDEVLIGPHVRVLTAGHSIDLGHESIIRNDLAYASVRIGRGAWLCAGCTILQGRNIGQGAVVGAGSVVTRDVPPFAVVVGNPAGIVRFRDERNITKNVIDRGSYKI
jgi:acetyltransferase-like isoleucine patch superfamily enzyme